MIKRLSILIILLLCFGGGGQTMAQDMMIAGKYDQSAVLTTGVVFALPVQGLHLATYADMGSNGGSANVDAMYIFKNGGWFFGPLAGPDFEIENVSEDGVDPLTYFVGATGLVGGYKFGDISIFGAFKYKFSFQGDDMYRDGAIYGLGLLFKL